MFDTKIMGNRIKKLRKNMSQDQCAKELGISRGALSFYENGDRKPDAELIYRMSKYFNVSSDYLLGLSDVASTDADIQNACKVTGLNEKTISSLRYKRMYMETQGNYEAEKYSMIANAIISSDLFQNILISCLNLLEVSTSYLENFKNSPQDIVKMAEKLNVPYNVLQEYIRKLSCSVADENIKFSDLEQICDSSRYNIFRYTEKICHMLDMRDIYLNYSVEELIEYLKLDDETLKQMREQGDDYGKHHNTEE
ncbi:MAG: helix-turn-helix domain-containing protein [Oscillospiraceae bacterium]|nr:helix-turn-helix domain-containing protein [Oscillospiraceae bacterium]